MKWLLLLFLCLIGIGLLISSFYGKEIKSKLVDELNKHLTSKITVDHFDFSVIRHFPFAALEMQKVTISDASSSSDTLLYAQKVSLLFSFVEIFTKDVSIRKLIVRDGKIHVKVDENGKDNYHFWKKGTESGNGGVIDLKRIILKNVDLLYTDQKDRQKYIMFAKNATLSGSFSSDQFKLICDADLNVKRLWIHDLDYLTEKEVELHSGLDVDTRKEIYRFHKSKITIAEVKFEMDGSIDNSRKNWLLNLNIHALESSLASLIRILPNEYLKYLRNYKTAGNYTFTSSVKGSVDGKNIPDVRIDFTVKEGKLSSPDASASLGNIDITGFYSNRSVKGKSVLEVPTVTADINGHAIKGNFKIDDFENPYLTTHASADLDLSEVKPFIRSDTLQSLSGKVLLNIDFNGKIKDLQTDLKAYTLDVSGLVDLRNVSFTLKNNPLKFENMNGRFLLRDKDITIQNFKGNVSSTDYSINGVFHNFFSFLLFPGEKGELQADVRAHTIDLDELLINKKSSGDDTSYIMKFNPRLICSLQIHADHLKFRRFHAEGISGNVNLVNQVITGRNLAFNAMKGRVQMEATINAARKDSLFMTYSTRFSRLDVTRLFYELENFDQTTLTDKNVKGVVNADVQFTSAWSNALVLNSRSVRSTASITIDNGELNDFSPIQALAKYIHVSDLNHIRFSTLTNTISIADRRITIPMMEIRSSAMDISGTGVHDFDNNIDYHIRLLLSDVLGRKVKNNNDEFGEIEDDGLGRTKLLLAMRGTVSNPKFSYDRKAAVEKLKNDIRNEKQTLKSILKSEFGIYKKDSTLVKKPKKKEELQVEWE